jgi:transaldolase (EC 2.2.1.2)
MKFFLDSANISEIQELAETGLIDGVTTNPSLIAKSGLDILTIIKEICQIIPHGPVSAEVTATDYATMMQEADKLRKLANNVAIKVPLTFDGLKTCRTLANDGTLVNVTLCFSANQALLAAKAGAAFISPFMGRLDDIGHDGTELIADIIDLYSNYPDFETEVLAASIRGPKHVYDVAMNGCHVATLPGKVFKQLYEHPLTSQGLDAFLADWAKTGQSIL